MKKLIYLIPVLLLGLAANAQASLYHGSVPLGDYAASLSDPGLIVGGDWDHATLGWDINCAGGTCTYVYTFNTSGTDKKGKEVFNKPGTSHTIFEVSSNFGEGNIKAGTSGGSGNRALDNYGPAPSNPGLDTTFYGLKFEDIFGEGTATITIVTDRLPMWGDFYAKGGKDSYAFNDHENDVYVPVPDTVVPIPGALSLLGTGLIGVAVGCRRRKQK